MFASAIARPVITLAVVASLAVVGMFSPDRAGSTTCRLKIQPADPCGDTSMETLKAFAEGAEKRSNGLVKVKVFADPAIFPGNHLFSAVKNNAVGMLKACGLFWSGMIPLAIVEVGLPMAFQFSENMSLKESA